MNAAHHQTDNDPEQNDDSDCFYETLDRLASSSECSCSPHNSDSETDRSYSGTESDDNDNDQINHFPVPKFPNDAFKFDVWVSEPISVSERRMRLLTEMGLSRDPSLSRIKPGNGGVSRSKSDSLSDKTDSGGDLERYRQCKSCSSSSNLFSVCSSSILFPGSDNTSSPGFVNNNLDSNCNHNVENDDSKLQNRNENAGPVVSQNKPPTGKNPKRIDENQSELQLRNEMHSSESEVINEEDSSNIEGPSLEEEVCTIKNLDNGTEFVVNGVGDDGTWNKVKEVGTGRQLTMEEFETCVGHSPIVQELMRRQNVEEGNQDNTDFNPNGAVGGAPKFKKRVNWLKSIKSVASSMTKLKERKSSDDKDTSSEKGGRRSSSATDDSQDVLFQGPERVRVRQYGKSYKELTAVYKSQEIQAHNGSIWCIKFSLDGRYLATAGEDCVIHVWQVVESERRGEFPVDKLEDITFNLSLLANGSPEPSSFSPKRRGRKSLSRKSLSLETIVMPDTVFGLSEKPICSFEGHLHDVLDLSWSKSQLLLSSSMDKTVRLWNLNTRTCLKIFTHSDYVTCIQFNPVDDRYFISGSLDAKVRIWSIPDRQVIDWNDQHEMVTAACYKPDGQAAYVGSYKGSCRLYTTSDNKLQKKKQINLQNRKKRSHHNKITGFEFVPGSSSEVLVTSADSRVRVVNDADLVHRFKGFRNTNSQISASVTANSKYVVAASEDSHVYVWKHEADSRHSKGKRVTVTNSHEHFHCQDVSVAVPWPGFGEACGIQDTNQYSLDNKNGSPGNEPTCHGDNGSQSTASITNRPLTGIISSSTNNHFFDRNSPTWPEEKLVSARNSSPRVSTDISSGLNPKMSAWGLVIVTAGLRGEIRTYQNFGMPVRI